jgi:hypothetical protein
MAQDISVCTSHCGSALTEPSCLREEHASAIQSLTEVCVDIATAELPDAAQMNASIVTPGLLLA